MLGVGGRVFLCVIDGWNLGGGRLSQLEPEVNYQLPNSKSFRGPERIMS